MAEGEEKLKSFLMSVKEESEKPAWNSTFKTLGSWLPVPIVHSKKVEVVTDFLILCFEITVKSDCSLEIKRHLPLRRKALTNLDSILKGRATTCQKKFFIVKFVLLLLFFFFPVVMYTCKVDHKDGWSLKKWCIRTVVLEKNKTKTKTKKISWESLGLQG